MKKKLIVLTLSTFWLGFAQEDNTIDVPESAEVFLEEYTDEFQNAFFEALKQKSIQNYDRAIHLLLECKQLNVATSVLDHELAKMYLLDKKYIDAQQYAIAALAQKPENYWYLDTLLQSLAAQSNTLDAIKESIPYGNGTLQKNLAELYFKNKEYEEASKIIQKMPESSFKQVMTTKLEEAKATSAPTKATSTGVIEVTNSSNPADALKSSLEQQIRLEQFRILELNAKQAVDEYPLQPFFHYAYGLALFKNKKQQIAISSLETALDYILDDIALANRIYKALADAYTETGNTFKANEYLRKVKPGF